VPAVAMTRLCVAPTPRNAIAPLRQRHLLDFER
jgi:hypothetical protein